MIRLTFILLLFPCAVFAEEKNWSGEIAAHFGAQSGNSSSLNTNTKGNMQWKSERFSHNAHISYALGYANGEKNRDRTETGLSIGAQILSTLVISSRVDLLLAPLDGYESRIFVGVGAAYQTNLPTQKSTWSISLAPGYLAEKTTDGKYAQLFSIIAASTLEYKPTDRLEITMDAQVNYTPVSTIIDGAIGIDTPLFGAVSIGIGVRGIYNFNPPDNKKPYDVITGINLAYSF